MLKRGQSPPSARWTGRTVPNTAPADCTIAYQVMTITAITAKNTGLPRKDGGTVPSTALQLIPFHIEAGTNITKRPLTALEESNRPTFDLRVRLKF